MLVKNEIHTAEIISYGSEGEGVCRISGIPVFVPFAVVGDVAEIKILKMMKSYAYGRIHKIITPSDKRILPKCDIFGRCGGCLLMHMTYDEQLRFKQTRVGDCIERIGKIKTKINTIIAPENKNRYRNKVQIPVSLSSDGNIETGFFAKRSHNVVNAENCKLQPSFSAKVCNVVKNWMQEYNISPYNEQDGTGAIRHIYIRYAEKTGQIMLAIVINKNSAPGSEYLEEELKKLNVTTAMFNINKKKTNVVLGDTNKIIYGDGKITDLLCGLKFIISPHSFYQVNREGAELLYKTAVEFAQISRDDIVFDVCCGIGTISLYAALFAKKVVGIEIVRQAIEDAKINAKINNLDNAEFYCGDAGETMEKLAKQDVVPDVVIVDPPRKGCDKKLLDAIVKTNVRRMVYVSCNPATLARDMAYLTENGFEAAYVQPVDMFPNTVHVECVSLLNRR